MARLVISNQVTLESVSFFPVLRLLG